MKTIPFLGTAALERDRMDHLVQLLSRQCSEESNSTGYPLVLTAIHKVTPHKRKSYMLICGSFFINGPLLSQAQSNCLGCVSIQAVHPDECCPVAATASAFFVWRAALFHPSHSCLSGNPTTASRLLTSIIETSLPGKTIMPRAAELNNI